MVDTMNDLPEVKDLPEIDFKNYRITPKFEEWRRLYLDKKNKQTFGNATQSAIQAYNLDPEKQYHVARTIGSENMSKHDNLQLIIRDYLSDNGFTLPVLINHALQMMADPKVKTTHWWKEIMLISGYKQEKAEIGVQQIQNTQININSDQVKEWNNKFREFLKQETQK